ncbi:kynureninase [Sphaeroforma arctica JP610]|uniref:Kynureninase n=1 Tax=Sphaeroforma arctica JP610 TaxID=667725 RepID=A0A0L0FWZ9_9EUKA|nr:kynureninase, variant [Sphaeroforma arctica JP610]XP_014154390.1 kynureninase [Sphaeroforma arctica JP610]KNC80487.1 kynureninase, variant [Sphaeroforma arctica JP610]KNC80488.1 kynureninase [Sphaeroforma arctica JP610]|eukprot:XP_014154389.1 kynureninase, variant [Sphaeroforma arctica JP610]
MAVTDASHAVLNQRANQAGLEVNSKEFAELLNKDDSIAHLRSEYHIPKNSGLYEVRKDMIPDSEWEKECIYLCGNSLGLQPKGTQPLVNEELLKWQRRGVQGHFDDSERRWVDIAEQSAGDMAKIVGADESEVVIMNTLTVNLHLMLASFYTPTDTRCKILIENKAFPSDHYAVRSQVKSRGYDPDTDVILVDTEGVDGNAKLIEAIKLHGDDIALVLLPGVQYYLGDAFDMKAITSVARQMGCVVGWDLAHAVGNIELQLHDWDLDFAVWCTYKYLNSGPGGIAGAFVHSRHHSNPELPRLTGWWSHNLKTRFKMDNEMDKISNAAAYAMSNPPMLQVVSLRASLNVFNMTSMKDLRSKSVMLTGYLDLLLSKIPIVQKNIKSLTSSDRTKRGCQLSLFCKVPVRPIFEFLEHSGVVCDLREPDVIRIAPVPMYNNFTDCYQFAQVLKSALEHHS